MQHLASEIEANFRRFQKKSAEECRAAETALKSHDAVFSRSYKRLVSLQAWRADLLESVVAGDALAFFIEAQNDGLAAHALASLGSWRASLQSLRGCIENVLCCLYYMDHPVELQLWEEGDQRLAFSELFSYFELHPKTRAKKPKRSGLSPRVAAVPTLQDEYRTLSRSVHASQDCFRMTTGTGGQTNLWDGAKKRLSMWETRERTTLSAVNLLLLAVFREHLSGAKLRSVRSAVGLAVPQSKHGDVRSELRVSLLRG